jgi:hypothetical protein
MTDRELMQMALWVLEDVFGKNKVDVGVIEALRARLAQDDPPCKTGSQCVGGKCERCAVEPEPVAWKDVPNFEKEYEVSSVGDIRNKKTGTILSKSLMGAGYIKADLWKDGVRWQTSAHRLVASAFIDNPEGLDEVNHINGNKTDNRVCNLEWVSRSDNVNHSYYDLGNQVKPVIATHIERGEKFYYPSISAAERDGFFSAHIINVINGKRKQHKGFTFSYANTAPPRKEPVIDKTMATRIATQLGWVPRKEWVGLTKGEADAAYKEMGLNYSYVDFARAIEAKLKEKNNGR